MLNLPKKDKQGNPYLSYSQMSTWKKSKRDYIRENFFKEKDTKDMLIPYGDFGHKVGEALENNDFSEFNKEEQKFLKTIPRYDSFEKKIIWTFDTFYIKGYVDTLLLTDNGIETPTHVCAIIDYKTGDLKKRKPEYESENYLQTDIYCAGLEQEFGVIPDKADVILIQRNGNAFKGEKLTLGNKFITINKPITQKRIAQVKQEIQEIAKDISEHYELFLKMNK